MDIDGILPIHFKFRFTFSEQDKTHDYEKNIPRWRTISRNLANKLISQYTISKMTGGIETLNKDGDRTWCHLHLHFDAIENRDTIAKYIKRYLTDTYDQTCHGPKSFSLKPEAVRSLDDFYSYAIKQSLDKKLCYGFTDEQLEMSHGIGKGTFLKVQQVRQAKMDKQDNSDTMFERLKKHLEQTQEIKKGKLLIAATKFYVEENKPINRTTIMGYVDTYMLQKELITYEEFWALPANHMN